MKKSAKNICDDCKYNQEGQCFHPENYEIIIIGRREKRVIKVVPKQGKCPYAL